jgi:hypothetical protein
VEIFCGTILHWFKLVSLSPMFNICRQGWSRPDRISFWDFTAMFKLLCCEFVIASDFSSSLILSVKAGAYPSEARHYTAAF